MPQYLAPGVYVEEVPGSPPILGVGTSTAAFIGVVDPTATNSDGSVFTMPFKPGRPEDPANPQPDDRYPLADEGAVTLVTNWEQFKTKFGDFQMGNRTLAHGVYGFLNNGGTTCYVVRVIDVGDAAEVEAALKKCEAVDEIALVAAPGALDAAVQLKLVEHCENMQDRFALIDAQETDVIDVGAVKGPLRNSDQAALYFPRVVVFDPVTRGPLPVHPSGHMAGVYARVDQQRGVHKAPANETVRGALDLAYRVSRNEQQLLNPSGVNVIRNLNGSIRVWGARTLGGNANGETMYVNVRRLLNFLRESIDEGTQFAVFEPNAQPLWQRITRSVTSFLTNVWRDGALFGTTPDQAFYVRCDETTNPAEVRNLGQVVTEIGVAIVRPAEFVIFRVTQMVGREEQ